MFKSLFCVLFLMLLLPTNANAKVEVNISNNIEGSTNKVKINSNTDTSFKSSGINQTDIVIENNGERKEYHGSDGNIHLESSDGKSSVKVNTTDTSKDSNKNSTSSVTSTTNIKVNTDTSEATSESANSEQRVAGVFKDNTKENKGFWEYFKAQIGNLFNIFF